MGILTADSANLTPRHLAAAGASYCPVTVMGMEHTTEFSSFLREDRTSFDAEKCRQEHIEAALELIRRDPGIGAILLECTNMPPWALDIHLATRLPVYDFRTMLCGVVAALRPPDYST